MSHAVCSDVAYANSSCRNPGCGCNATCAPGCSATFFRSVWDRLCQQLFGAIPAGMNAEDQLPDITIWKDGVVLVDDTYPYTFRILSPAGISPKPCDVVLYKGKYYVIGAVDE